MTDERIIAYLLEELPQEELEQFEDECFAQESWPEQLSAVEEELIESYLRNELTKERRERFERNYLTTEARQERLLVSAALLRHLDEQCASQQEAGSKEADARPHAGLSWGERFRALFSTRPWALPAAVGCVLVAIIAASLWFTLFRTSRPKTFATLSLSISTSNRADAAQAGRVRLPLNADALKLSLSLPEQPLAARDYRVELENDRGVITPLQAAEHNAQAVVVIIPAAQLERGQYALRLFAKRPDGTDQRISGSYFFIVE